MDPIYLTDEQFEKLRPDLAKILADRAEAKAGGLDQLIELDLTTVSRITGLSRPTISRRMDVIETDGKHTVSLGSLLSYRAKRTKKAPAS